MKLYEGFFIFPPEAGPEARKNQERGLEELIKKFQGNVLQRNEWGKRPLGYPLKKYREGHFLLLDFQIPPLQIADLRKALELQEDLLKFMLTVKKTRPEKKLTEKSSVAAGAGVPSQVPPRS